MIQAPSEGSIGQEINKPDGTEVNKLHFSNFQGQTGLCVTLREAKGTTPAELWRKLRKLREIPTVST